MIIDTTVKFLITHTLSEGPKVWVTRDYGLSERLLK